MFLAEVYSGSAETEQACAWADACIERVLPKMSTPRMSTPKMSTLRISTFKK